MLTILVTSPRVAPGLLSWPAWAALREASRVLVGSAGHPQVTALTEAGVVPEVVDAPADVADLARMLAAAAAATSGPVIWLAPAGPQAGPDLLAALAGTVIGGTVIGGAVVGGAANDGSAGDGVRVLHGTHDLPGAHLIDVAATMSTLRTSCPWDRRQTHASLAPHLIEESYEALDALEQGDQQALREELGDVLLQVAFHAAIAAERGPGEDGYTIDDIADTLVAKLVRRHPHVFADVSADSPDEVIRNWDEIKKAERAAKLAAAGGGGASWTPSVLDGIALAQPALSLAAQVLRRAARARYPAELTGAWAAGDANDDAPDLGAQLMGLVARAREADVEPEIALRVTVRDLMERIRDFEQSAMLRSGAGPGKFTFPRRFIRVLASGTFSIFAEIAAA